MGNARETIGKDVRKVIPIGGSLAVTLPAEYVRAHKIKAGDKIELVYNRVFLGEPLKDEVVREKLFKLRGDKEAV